MQLGKILSELNVALQSVAEKGASLDEVYGAICVLKNSFEYTLHLRIQERIDELYSEKQQKVH